MDITTSVIAVGFVVVVSVIGFQFVFATFYRPYILINLSITARQSASFLWNMARVARSPEEREELFDMSEKIGTLATTIRENRIGFAEWQSHMEKIKSGVKRVSALAALADTAVMFLMIFALAARYPVMHGLFLLISNFAYFLGGQWKQAREFFLSLKAETWDYDMPQRTTNPVPSH